MLMERQSKSLKIAKLLREELAGKRLKAGTPVGSSRELAKQYQISPVTAEKVLNLLVAEDILYRLPQSGTFVKHDPPLDPVIGYSGVMAGPTDDFFRHFETSLILKGFEKAGLSFNYVPFNVLCEPSAASKVLKKMHGLFMTDGFLQELTLPQIQHFGNRIMISSLLYEAKIYPCNQMIIDFTSVMAELVPQVMPYKRIVIIRSEWLNSIFLEQLWRKKLKGHSGVETVVLPEPLQNNARKYFSQHHCGWENTVVILLSDLFSLGMRDAFEGKKMPDAIGFDNIERYQKSDREPYFTSVDLAFERRCFEGIMQLKKMILENDDRTHIIRIPAHLEYRQSFRPKTYHKQRGVFYEGKNEIHIDRASYCNCDHRDSRGSAVAGVKHRAGKGQGNQVYRQFETNRACSTVLYQR